MCTIIGYKSLKISENTIHKALESTYSRGPDDERIQQVGCGYLGFQRLSIMGLSPEGMQPFVRNNNLVVCNGEIYGFRKLKEELEKDGYTFISQSDCEILLPLYEKYGLDMFKKLDAEYACIIYDAKKNDFVAARDPIGIRPLFYGYDKNHNIVFASEAKNLVSIVEQIFPFPPGFYYADGKFTCYLDVTKVDKVITSDLETICTNIHDKLVEGVKKRLDADAPLGFLLSGGLDSSLVCAISQIIINKEDVLHAIKPVIKTLATFDITTIRASIGMYLICKAIHEQSDIRVLLTGEISDELFGYKYTDFAPSKEEFQEESIKRVHELYMYDVLRADRCISTNSIEARVPFGDLDFVKYVMSIDPEKKMNTYHKGKYLLRHAFEKDEILPYDILMREKAAFSDAVGHSLSDDIKEYAQSYYTDEEFKEKVKKYKYCTPFTKESLLYREIFESYYPNQASMIKDFWMPNKNWEGCNVNDPSARYLSNYGDSGK